METRYRDYVSHRRHGGSLGFGVVVILVGAALLLDNLGIVRLHDLFRFWPVAIIAAGLSAALDARDSGGQIAGGLIMLVGAWLLADRLHLFFFRLGFHQLWPVLLIGFGFLLLWKNFERARPAVPGEPVHAVFGGGKRQVTSEFAGGKVDVVFGGYELDLRAATMTADEAFLQVSAVFGGIEVTIPENWSASLQGKAVFGGFDDKTRQPIPGTPGLKRLIVSGDAVFGGVVVKN